jgi:hypothetical protein
MQILRMNTSAPSNSSAIRPFFERQPDAINHAEKGRDDTAIDQMRRLIVKSIEIDLIPV